MTLKMTDKTNNILQNPENAGKLLIMAIIIIACLLTMIAMLALFTAYDKCCKTKQKQEVPYVINWVNPDPETQKRVNQKYHHYNAKYKNT
jgi:hypothetical protein